MSSYIIWMTRYKKEERKEIYKQLVYNWYHNKTLEEKKALSKKYMNQRKGHCEKCNVDVKNIYQHRKTKKHLNDLKSQ